MRSIKRVTTALLCATVIWAMEPLIALSQSDGPIDSAALSRQYMEAHSAGDWDRAIKVGHRWVKLRPKDAIPAYNLACAYARSGDSTRAIKWLNKCIELGYDEAGHMTRDPDFASIRDESGFRRALEAAKALQKPRLEQAAKGKPIIIDPQNQERSGLAPLLIVLHGYGGNADRFVEQWRSVAVGAGAILVAPRAVRSVSMSGFSWGSIEEAEAIVNGALKQISSVTRYDPDKVIVAGFSQGAHMAMGLAMRDPAKFRGAISVAGRYDASLAMPDIKSPDASQRFYLMVGEKDRPGILVSNRQAEADLSSRGASVRLVVFSELGHSFPKNALEELTKAISFVLSDGN